MRHFYAQAVIKSYSRRDQELHRDRYRLLKIDLIAQHDRPNHPQDHQTSNTCVHHYQIKQLLSLSHSPNMLITVRL